MGSTYAKTLYNLGKSARSVFAEKKLKPMTTPAHHQKFLGELDALLNQMTANNLPEFTHWRASYQKIFFNLLTSSSRTRQELEEHRTVLAYLEKNLVEAKNVHNGTDFYLLLDALKIGIKIKTGVRVEAKEINFLNQLATLSRYRAMGILSLLPLLSKQQISQILEEFIHDPQPSLHDKQAMWYLLLPYLEKHHAAKVLTTVSNKLQSHDLEQQKTALQELIIITVQRPDLFDYKTVLASLTKLIQRNTGISNTAKTTLAVFTEKCATFFNKTDITLLLRDLHHDYASQRAIAFDILRILANKRTDLFEQVDVEFLINKLKTRVLNFFTPWFARESSLKALGLIAEKNSHLFTEEDLETITNCLSDGDEVVRLAAFDAYRILVEKRPELLKEKSQQQILEDKFDYSIKAMFLPWYTREAGLKELYVLAYNQAEIFEKKHIPIVINKFISHKNGEGGRQVARQTIAVLAEKRPALFTREHMETILKQLSPHDERHILKADKKLLNVLTRQRPDLFLPLYTDVQDTLKKLCDERWYVRKAALHALRSAPLACPDLLSKDLLSEVCKTLVDTNQYVRKTAEEVIHCWLGEINDLNLLPHLIPHLHAAWANDRKNVLHNLLLISQYHPAQFSEDSFKLVLMQLPDKNNEVGKAAERIVRELSVSRPDLFNLTCCNLLIKTLASQQHAQNQALQNHLLEVLPLFLERNTDFIQDDFLEKIKLSQFFEHSPMPAVNKILSLIVAKKPELLLAKPNHIQSALFYIMAKEKPVCKMGLKLLEIASLQVNFGAITAEQIQLVAKFLNDADASMRELALHALLTFTEKHASAFSPAMIKLLLQILDQQAEPKLLNNVSSLLNKLANICPELFTAEIIQLIHEKHNNGENNLQNALSTLLAHLIHKGQFLTKGLLQLNQEDGQKHFPSQVQRPSHHKMESRHPYKTWSNAGDTFFTIPAEQEAGVKEKEEPKAEESQQKELIRSLH
ncbi:HEAT repeat domain-containing protein [Legionella septentrionalis]|uniref:HEAT repeat domain-containing protein n=1 Tax=Legionella septentrionalis TaxID=2498109 RepID=UPI000F8DA042|nr:HEAT repeat domain-containing protein [Legionella septentrionalis]RUR10638.1 hypothetical protein ELY14_04805 [Legionella septentrionalis]